MWSSAVSVICGPWMPRVEATSTSRAGDRALDELRPGEQRLDEPEPRHPLDDVRRQQQSVDGNAHRHDDLGVVEVRLRGVEALLRAHA